MSRIDSAIAFAAHAHSGQVRKYSGVPYITHPIDVMMILHRHGIRDERMLIAAILHDTVEDTSVTLCTIERRFGSDVAELVDELTDKFPAGSGGNRAERKAKERERIGRTSPRSQTIKYADLLSNTESIISHDPGFATRYLDEKRLILEVATKGDEVLYRRAYESLVDSQAFLVQNALEKMP